MCTLLGCTPRQERKPAGPPQPVLMQAWVLSLNSAVFKPFVLPPCCKRVELVALLATRVWLGLGFLEVFKGRLPSRTSEHAAGRVAVVGCQRLDSTHTGRSIFLGGGSCCWDSAKPEAGSVSEPGTCTSFPQGWQTR